MVTTPRPARVLVVDDEPAICVLIRVLLEAQGYEVRTAPDGAARWWWCAPPRRS